MAVDESVIKSRITEILNVVAPGTFSSTIASTNLDRNATAIAEAWREAAMMIAMAVLANPNHVHRGVFVSGTPTALTHGGEMPDMSAECDLIEIQPYSAGTFAAGTPRSVQQVNDYRSNYNNSYGSIVHTTQGSPLAGYYAISNGRVYFTGYAAQIYIPLIDRTTVSSLIPDEYEGTGVKLSVGLCLKEGDNLQPIGQMYYNWGLQDLSAITAMGTIMPVPPPQRALEARSDV